MAIPSDPLREKFKRVKERRMAELLEKYQQTEKDGGTVKKEDEIQKPKEDVKNDSDRIIGSSKETFETSLVQQKIDPVITTRDVAISTEANQVLLSPTTCMMYVKDKGVQTLTMPIIKKKRKCTNCCGGLPGCGPGLGQGCDGKCSCVPGIDITTNELYDEDEFNLSRKLFPRFYVTRNRLRGGGGGGGKNLRKNVMAKIRSRRKKNRVFQVVSSLGRPKEDLLCRGFVRSLSSLRGQRMERWLEKAQESCWESCCLLGKNCVGRVSVSAECVPSSYNNYVSYVVSGVPERHRRRRQNFRLEQNIMADGSTSITTNVCRKFQRETTTSTTLLLSNTSKYHGENIRMNRRLYRRLKKFDIPKKTISNISCPMKNCSHLFSYNMKRVERTKTYKDCNFSKGILPCKNSSSYETLNIVERLRGGGSKCNLTEQQNKIRQELDQSLIDDLNDTEIKSLNNNNNNNNNINNIDSSNAMFYENMDEDEYPWSDNVINEDVLRFQEEQDHYDDDGGDGGGGGGGGGGSENRNEDGRIRGGCGGLYKPIQHFSNAWTIFGRRNLQHTRGSCCTPGRPQISCRSSPCPPISCLRSSPTCTTVKFQNRCKDCPCNYCGGPICSDEINRCHGIQLNPCQIKCHTCKGFRFRICGGCGGQSCGRIYSCSGSGGGTCCFPRNTGRRSDSECCGSGNSNCGGCC